MLFDDLLNNYKIIKQLGKGSYGTVELIEHGVTREQFALKTMETIKKDEINGIINEINIMKKFNSKYITKIIDWVYNNRTIYILMEYAPLGDLDQLIKKCKKDKKKLDDKIIRRIIYQTACGLRDLHENRILHRDIKPSNILIFSDFEIKLGDFGVSKILTYCDNAYTQIGTPYYMSPEIIQGNPYSYSNDFWGLGCVYYEMVSLEKPFDGTNILGLFKNILNAKPDYKKIPLKYKHLIVNLLNGEKSKRYDCRQIFAYYVKHLF